MGKLKSLKLNAKVRAVLIALFWVVLWGIAAFLIDSNLLFPGPLETLSSLFSLLKEKSFYVNTLFTVLRVFFGVGLSFSLGYLLSYISYRHVMVRELLKLPVTFLKSVPVMAIIIYLILVLTSDSVVVFVCFFMCFPIAYTNLLSGFDNLSKSYLELGKAFNLSANEINKYIFRPGIMPNVIAALDLMCSISWKVVIAAEVLAIPAHSLGYQMMNARYYLETSELFSYILVIIMLSFISESLVRLIMKRYRWKGYSGSRLKMKKNSAQNTHSYLGLSNVSKAFGDNAVLKDFSIELKKGEVATLFAPSGSGKTTIARILSGFEKEDSGEVISTDSFSYLFQEDRLLPWLNVFDNLSLSMECDEKEVVEMAKALEIDDVLFMLPEELSGGTQHRVALGRTFLKNSELLILDEPFRGLDTKLRERIISELWGKETKDKFVLLITHDEEIKNNLSDRVVDRI